MHSVSPLQMWAGQARSSKRATGIVFDMFAVITFTTVSRQRCRREIRAHLRLRVQIILTSREL